MRGRVSRPRAFTVVELLVVIAIIGVLLALIFPSLSGVRRQSRKTNELNSLKHVGLAWMMYANSNADALLPGYLEAGVQEEPVSGVSRGWGVMYKYPNKVEIPIDPIDPIAGPWTWRLLPFLDFNHEVVHGYTGEEGWEMATVDTDPDEARAVAYEPAFGYNGYYLGGYWKMIPNFSGPVSFPRPMFWNHCRSGSTQAIDIPQSHSQIARSSDMVAFCSSSKLSTGVHQRLPEDIAGAHLVAPPYLGDVEQWGRVRNVASGSGPDIGSIEVFAPGTAYVPITRYTNTAAFLFADGHTDQTSPMELIDQRRWINSADNAKFTHTPCPP